MPQLKIGSRVFLVSFFLVVAGVTITSAISSFVFVRTMRNEMDYTVLTATDGLRREIDATFERMSFFCQLLTSMDEPGQLIVQRRTDDLNELMLPYLKVSEFDTITVTDAEGTVLSRPHAAHIIGDNISEKGYIGPALKGQRAQTVERGTTIGVGLFYGLPVIRDSEIVGAIAVGVNLGEAHMLDQLASMYRAEVTLYYGDRRVSTTLRENGRRLLETRAKPEVVEAVMGRGEQFYGELTLADGNVLRTLYKPFVVNGRRIGMLSAGASTYLLERAIASVTYRVVAAATIFILLAMGTSWLFARSIDRLAAEKNKQQTFLNLLMKNSPDTILIFDDSGRFIHCTDAFMEEIRISSFDEISGRMFSEVLGDFLEPGEIDRLWLILARAMQDKKNISLNKTLDFSRGNNPRTYTIRFTPMLDANGSTIGAMALFHDLTDFLQARQAEAASQAKSAFLASMSHEIRTPLNAVVGLSEIELRNNLSDETHDNLEKIHRSGATLLGIINDILDISKIESGKFEIVPVEYDFSNLVSDAIHQNVVRIATKPVVFEPRIDANIPARLYGDEIRVRQILNNLLSNAFKYTKEGKVILQVSGERENDKIRMKYVVSDTGIGIKKEDLENLFSEYKQFDIQANRRIEGTGLGLSICKNLVEMMSGTIELDSEHGKGSTFTVTFFQGIIDPTPIGLEAVQNLKTFRLVESRRDSGLVRRPMTAGKVLIVDDVPTNLDVAKGLMMPYGLTIHCASSGRQAVEIMREAKILYDVIFMDHMLPDMDGVEAARIIRDRIGSEYAKNVPIIALTANALVGNEEMFLKNGFQGFLSKPIDVMKLDLILNTWISDRQTEETQRRPEGPKAPLSDFDGSDADTEMMMIDGVDVAEGLARFGNEKIYREILFSYLSHIPELLDKIRQVDEESLPAYAVTVHGIKGSSYGINADRVGKMAEELESAAKRGDIETLKARNGAFIDAVDTLLANLRALRKKDTKDEAAGEESPPDPAALAAEKMMRSLLRQALEDKNIGIIDNILKRMAKNSLNASTREAVSRISDLVLIAEFEEAIAIIDGLSGGK
ncbi:MAG: cache domain-containing protein [Synergistaceae bacterium]|nr:cache domain-containing protein [Synergistaceae bacterium]